MLWDNYLLERKRLKKRGTIQKDLVELILLRKFIAMEAIPETIAMTKEAIAQGRKVIIFTNFTEELETIVEELGQICVKHNGPMSAAAKQDSVDEFQSNPKVKVFVGNEKSAGVGITLTEATVVIFNSYDWVPGINQQAEDRAYRIGQKNDVNIYYQLFLDTVSIKMWDALQTKQDVIATIMGDNDMSEEEKIAVMAEKLLLQEDD
jgi:SNF2 family DNA or RNA helicase